MNNKRMNSRYILSIQYPEGIRTILLQKERYLIGRDRHNEIILLDTTVSRCHAMLVRVLVPNSKDYCYRVIDGDLSGKASKNGIYINLMPCSSKDLEDGDLISFASVYASYHIQATGQSIDEYGNAQIGQSVKTYASLSGDRYPTNPGHLESESHAADLEEQKPRNELVLKS